MKLEYLAGLDSTDLALIDSWEADSRLSQLAQYAFLDPVAMAICDLSEWEALLSAMIDPLLESAQIRLSEETRSGARIFHLRLSR